MSQYKERFCRWCNRYKPDIGFKSVKVKGKACGYKCPDCQKFEEAK